MQLEWDEAKRLTNLKKHELDFEDAATVFEGVYLEVEDTREDYGEPRFKVLGMLRNNVIVLIYAPRSESIRIISMRKADSDESNEYFETLGYELGET
jgi:uncharacterized protein